MISKKYLAALAGSVLVLAPMLAGCNGDDSTSQPKVSHTATVSETPEESETPTTEEPTEDETEASEDAGAGDVAASGTTINSGSSNSGGASGSRPRANSTSSGSSGGGSRAYSNTNSGGGSGGGSSAGSSAAANPAPAPAGGSTYIANSTPLPTDYDSMPSAGTITFEDGSRWEVTEELAPDPMKLVCELGTDNCVEVPKEEGDWSW